MKRRAFLLCGPALLLACGGAAPVVATPKVRETTLHLSPLTELLQAPGMVWLVDAAPKHLREAGLERAISRIVTGRAFDDFKGRNGGIDLREMDEVMVASYGGVTVSGVRGLLDPGAVERAFTSRATGVPATMLARRIWLPPVMKTPVTSSSRSTTSGAAAAARSGRKRTSARAAPMPRKRAL